MKLQTKLDSLRKVKQTETSNCCACFAVVSLLTVVVAGGRNEG